MLAVATVDGLLAAIGIAPLLASAADGAAVRGQDVSGVRAGRVQAVHGAVADGAEFAEALRAADGALSVCRRLGTRAIVQGRLVAVLIVHVFARALGSGGGVGP